MIAAALALLLTPQTPYAADPSPPVIVWQAAPVETPQSAPQAKPQPPKAEHTVPDWGLADPFGFERARCSPLVRGETPLGQCQTEVREQLALALGADLPEALRPPGMAGDCQMMRSAAGGSSYALQCGSQTSSAAPASGLTEMDCRPRPVQGGFSSECRPIETTARKGLSITLWGDDD